MPYGPEPSLSTLVTWRSASPRAAFRSSLYLGHIDFAMVHQKEARGTAMLAETLNSSRRVNVPGKIHNRTA